MPSPIIDIRDLHLSLVGGSGSVNILQGIDLTVNRGQTVCVVGPSGAGKTTLLMALSGLEKPSRGSIAVAQRDLSKMDEDELARFRCRHVGIVFQAFHLVPTMTAQENVALPLEFAGNASAAERAAEALDATGLGHRLKHFPGQLSGGEQQRVALARAFVARPSLLLADEPTGNLDSETGEKVMNLLFDLQREHDTTMILVTHDSSLTSRCQRTIRMEDGRLLPGSGSAA